MMWPSASPGESSTQQAGNAGVPPPPAHVAPNAAVVVGPPEESSGQQDPDSSRRRSPWRLEDFIGGRREGSPDEISPDPDDSSGTRRPPPVQLRPMDAMGGRRDEESLDLLSPNSSSHRPAQGRPGDAPAGVGWLVVVGFCFLTFNSGMAIYRSWGDSEAISFVASAYLTLVGLFYSVNKFQAAPPNSRMRKGLMACIWIFTVSLASQFVYQTIGTTTKPTLHLTLLLLAMPAAIGASVFIIFWDRSGAPLGEELLDVRSQSNQF